MGNKIVNDVARKATARLPGAAVGKQGGGQRRSR